MKKFLALIVCSLLLALPLTAQTLDSNAVLDYVDDLFRGDSSYGTFTMKVVTAHYSREMKMEAWSKGKDYSLIRIQEPKKERGTATLKADKNIWNYLPKVDRVIKVPSSMMGGAWMGSHFTNDDLVKESRMAEDFSCAISFEGQRDGKDIIELTLIPKEFAAVVWGKVVVVVLANGWMPLTIDYYDEGLTKTRSMTFADIRELGGRKLPAITRMTPTDKQGEYTEIIYHEMQFEIELDDEIFSIRNLKK